MGKVEYANKTVERMAWATMAVGEMKKASDSLRPFGLRGWLWARVRPNPGAEAWLETLRLFSLLERRETGKDVPVVLVDE